MNSQKNILTRVQIRRSIQKTLDLPIKDSNAILEGILSSCVSLLKDADESIKIFSFGTFLIHHKKKRMGRNPQTKEDKVILPRRSISFRASATLKDRINSTKT